MSQQWFYGQEGNKLGPCTAQQLRDLAAAGSILVSDTVWKDGVATGVLANRVKNLFPELPAPVVSAGLPKVLAAQPLGADGSASEENSAMLASSETPVLAAAAETAQKPTPASQSKVDKIPVKKLRALAVQGAKIFSQDGTDVSFKKICTKCGHEDSSRTTMKIRTGNTRINFFCPKCRKPRDVMIQGMN